MGVEFVCVSLFYISGFFYVTVFCIVYQIEMFWTMCTSSSRSPLSENFPLIPSFVQACVWVDGFHRTLLKNGVCPGCLKCLSFFYGPSRTTDRAFPQDRSVLHRTPNFIKPQSRHSPEHKHPAVWMFLCGCCCCCWCYCCASIHFLPIHKKDRKLAGAYRNIVDPRTMMPCLKRADTHNKNVRTLLRLGVLLSIDDVLNRHYFCT